ncbi:MAG: hypothetical protein IJR32_02600 [Paludibacteraceae bacterium]|nr:hypothetical protein [Paludibacteraceae bacterium]MCR4619521.1 hypothetical protein [Paludibacteraceae bacterium]
MFIYISLAIEIVLGIVVAFGSSKAIENKFMKYLTLGVGIVIAIIALIALVYIAMKNFFIQH